MALSRREKMLLTVPFVVGGLLGFYNWVHEPLFARRAEAQTLSEQVQADLVQSQNRLNREGDLRARLQAVEAREQLLDAWVPGKNSAALFIWYLSQAELQSGARIRSIQASEREEIRAAAPQEHGQGSGQAAGQPQGEQEGVFLTLIQLELAVDARFAEHLLFNQALEEMPLFLNTEALSLTRAEEPPVERVAELVAQGDSWLAAQILTTSPPVDGVYRINLYFKNGKQGPATDQMQFSEPAGRMDPFVMDSVDEFIQTVIEHYRYQGKPDRSQPGRGRNDGGFPDSSGGQLG